MALAYGPRTDTHCCLTVTDLGNPVWSVSSQGLMCVAERSSCTTRGACRQTLLTAMLSTCNRHPPDCSLFSISAARRPAVASGVKAHILVCHDGRVFTQDKQMHSQASCALPPSRLHTQVCRAHLAGASAAGASCQPGCWSSPA